MKEQLKNKKILYVYTGDHPVHRAFAKSIGADIKKMSWNIPRGYDVYFSEGSFFRPIILRMLGRISRKSKIINLFSDPRIFYFHKKMIFSNQMKVERASKIKLFLFNFLMKKLDGAVCVGKFEKSILEKYLKKPIARVNVFVGEDFQKSLLKISPSLKNRQVLFIGNGPNFHYKGVDLLVEVARSLEREKIKFIVIGECWNDFYKNCPSNLSFEGHKNQSEFFHYFEDSSLYIHLGRGEAFGVTALEAMTAGLPVMVSELTGAKEIVGKVRKDFVLPLEKEKIVKKIKEYFSFSMIEKMKLSKEFRQISKQYSQQSKLNEFKKKFGKLLTEIYG